MKKKYRIVKEWKTRYNPITNKVEQVGGARWYIEYRTLETILFWSPSWRRPLEYCEGFESEKDALAEVEGLLKPQEKITTHKQIIFKS